MTAPLFLSGDCTMTAHDTREETIEFSDFMKVEVRVGTIVDVQEFPEARRPAYKLFVDFGAEIGQRKTSAQVTQNYTREELIGRQVAAVINFPPKQVGKFMSEILVLGFPDENGNVTLIRPDKAVPNGGRLY
jgi:tRNA-binding protein